MPVEMIISLFLPFLIVLLLKLHQRGYIHKAWEITRDSAHNLLTPQIKTPTLQLLTQDQLQEMEADALHTHVSELIRQGEDKAIREWNAKHPKGPLYARINTDGQVYYQAPRAYEFTQSCSECEWETHTTETNVRWIRTNPCPVHAIRQQPLFPTERVSSKSDQEWLSALNGQIQVLAEVPPNAIAPDPMAIAKALQLAPPPLTFTPPIRCYPNQSLTVRPSPDLNATTSHTVGPTAMLRVDRVEGRFARIKLGSHHDPLGWVLAEFLEVNDPALPAWAQASTVDHYAASQQLGYRMTRGLP